MALLSEMRFSASMLLHSERSLTVSSRVLSSLPSLASSGMEWRAAKASRVLKAILSIGGVLNDKKVHTEFSREPVGLTTPLLFMTVKKSVRVCSPVSQSTRASRPMTSKYTLP